MMTLELPRHKVGHDRGRALNVQLPLLSVPSRRRRAAAVRLAQCSRVLTWPQPVEDFPGVWHNKGVRVGFVSADVDRRGVQVVEVDSADNLLGDAGGERDSDPVALTMFGIPGA
jgi:hypothetical protein